MTTTTNGSKRKERNDKLDKLIGPTDPRIDAQARDRLIGARVALLLKHSFFGNLATRLKLVNADEWCATAATDGKNFYYNARFINMLTRGEVEFLFGHEVLHVCYDHMGRRGDRDHQIFNIANDYAVNADLKRNKVGDFIKTVPCLYEAKYDGKASEEIYEDLMKNAKKINLDQLIDQMLDEHMDGDGDGDGEDGEDGDKPGRGKRPAPMSQEERDQLRQEIRQNIIAAARASQEGGGAGNLPLGIQRMIEQMTEPKMPWRELIQTNLTSAIKSDYTWNKPSRRGWHMDAILPSQTPGQEIDVVIALDMSGSISNKQAQAFLGEISGMTKDFDAFKLRVFSFDTEVYNEQEFSSENMDDIMEYEPKGGGGTDFDCIYKYLKNTGLVPKRLIIFTDLFCSTFGDEDYCDTTWIIFENPTGKPPHGSWAYYDEYE